MASSTSQSGTVGVPPFPSMSHAEQSPAAVGGGVRGNPHSELGVVTSPVSATLVHPPVGGPDQIPNTPTASPVSSYTRFHQLVRPMAIRLETTRVSGQITIPVLLASQQAEVSAVTSLATLALSPKHSNTCTTTSATINDNHNNCRALTSTNTTLTFTHPLLTFTNPALTRFYHEQCCTQYSRMCKCSP